MKRTYAVFILALILIVGGCGRGSDSSKQKEAAPTPTTENTKDINSKAAESFMEHYMTYVVDMNDNAKRSFYSSSLLQEIGSEEAGKEPHVVGYILGDNEASEDGSSYSASLLCEVTGEPGFSIDTYNYTLINENGTIKIDKISKESSMELIGEDDKIYLKKDEESEKQLSVTLDDLPDYSVMQTGALPEQKFPVPKKKFTSCGMAPDGENIIVTSTDDGSACFIAKVTMKQEKETLQQGDDKQDDKQGGDNQGEDKQDKEKSQEKEKSKGMVKPLDLINGCQVYGITFSPEFDKFIVGLLYSDGTKGFRIYDMESGKIVDAQIAFLGEKVSSEMPYFVSSKEIQFNVNPSEDATDEEKSYKGKWGLDLESGKVKQIQ